MEIDNEFRGLIPPLTAEEYAGLEKSLIEEGCRDALIVWDDTLIDGHNRHEICTKHGIPFKASKKVFKDRESVKEWIILNQFGRRNLSAYDRSLLALKLKGLFTNKAKANQGERKDLTDNIPQISGECNKKNRDNETNVKLAKVAGVSHDTIHKVEKIEQKAPEEIKQKVKHGDISINQAYQQVRKQEKIEKVEEKISQSADIPTGKTDIYNTDKKYSIIYADPPWQYWEGGQKNQSLHYKTMSMEDIRQLPVKNVADDNCILFLWITYPILQECFKIIESWGFKYSTCGFVWVKKNKNIDTPFIGCGSWTRANSELCLIATKGKIDRMDAGISQVIECPIMEHSKKPDETRDKIIKLVGALPRIELFARTAPDGWDYWGNEV